MTNQASISSVLQENMPYIVLYMSVYGIIILVACGKDIQLYILVRVCLLNLNGTPCSCCLPGILDTIPLQIQKGSNCAPLKQKSGSVLSLIIECLNLFGFTCMDVIELEACFN